MTKDRNPIGSMFYAIPKKPCHVVGRRSQENRIHLSCVKIRYRHDSSQGLRDEYRHGPAPLIKNNDPLSRIENPLKVWYRHDGPDHKDWMPFMAFQPNEGLTMCEQPLRWSGC